MKKIPAYTRNACYSTGQHLAALLLLISAVPFSSAQAAAIAGGNYKLAHGWNYIGKADVTISMTMKGANGETKCVNTGYWFFDYSGWFILGGTLAKSSDSVATGWKSTQSNDVLLVFRGGQVDGQNLNSSCSPTQIPPATWNSSGQYSVSPKMSEWGDQWKGGVTVKSGDHYLRWQKAGVTITSRVNTDIYIYIGPNAVLGNSYNIPEVRLAMQEHGTNSTSSNISGAMDITVRAPRICTVKTDNTITFPAVDITDAVNAKALANKAGNFAITCDDTTNAPVTVEMQGLKGRYTDTMALTMTDGTNAPAEIRGFIGSDIPLGGECNGSLNGYTGIVYFIPNAGLEKMPFKPGSYKYNWVLCSTGAYKTGKATGSAKMVVSWD
ncbi:hypothetical protein JC794_07340 [Morganella morganii]|uniref:hypothetical protein n=1 Tax=Morganella morganii TaxID=582 RepID=UPI000D1EC813|nr:hypothetical protein [Morganella morganii]HAE77677.1 hypothetical protein [Morganella sp. (in: enterobacteria)]QXO43977.1 hypothetical protein CXB74_007085 [Morganella morganii]QXO47565.1 hypothetical protein JC862_06955 [Morganella morganii]QXO51350.1 hypothetical protein JC861_07060 [Morganella morganii]QXO55214.1 hypothetical protein JC830_07060 [Morganella morganii]